MKKAIGIKIICLLLVSGCKESSEKAQLSSETAKKPNIIFLFSDDQSFKDVNALGNPEVITPTMDKLAENGTTFTHTYNMGGWNGAICVASRAMIISGRSIWRAQQISGDYSKNENLDKNTILIVSVWNNQQSNKDEKLRNCYVNSVQLAEANDLTSIAFPNISTGVYRFPKYRAAAIAIKAVKDFSPAKIERVVFVCFDVDNFEIYEELLKTTDGVS